MDLETMIKGISKHLIIIEPQQVKDKEVLISIKKGEKQKK